MPRITKRYVDSLKGNAADLVYWDDDLTGFGVRVRPSGGRSYVFAYRAGGGRRGRLRKMTLGAVGRMTPDQARKAAQDANARAMAGEDPAAEKQAQRADLTVAELVERYLEKGSEARPDKKASSWASDRSNLKRHVVPLLGRRRASLLTRRDIEQMQADITAGKTKAPVTAKGARKRGRVRVSGGPAVGARATAAASSMFAWAVERRLIKQNPAAKVRLNKIKGRERFLGDDELARLGETVAEMEDEGVNPGSLTIARLLILTGARRNEIASLRWSYVDVQRGALLLPDSKTGQKTVPLGGPALAVLVAWGEQSDDLGDDRYVFPATRGDGYHVGYAKVWRQLRDRAGLSGVRLHDLRHTHASVGVALNQSLQIIGKVLGHKKAATSERYAHLQLDPVRAAADQTAKRLSNAMRGGGSNSKVVRLARPK
jgi:integrase